jgi:hypothetical protein
MKFKHALRNRNWREAEQLITESVFLKSYPTLYELVVPYVQRGDSEVIRLCWKWCSDAPTTDIIRNFRQFILIAIDNGYLTILKWLSGVQILWGLVLDDHPMERILEQFEHAIKSGQSKVVDWLLFIHYKNFRTRKVINIGKKLFEPILNLVKIAVNENRDNDIRILYIARVVTSAIKAARRFRRFYGESHVTGIL